MPKWNKQSMRIVTAKPFAEEIVQRIALRFAKELNLSEYKIEHEVAPDLMGGFVVYVAGYCYDYSAKGYMADLGEKLLNKPLPTEILQKNDGDLQALLKESLFSVSSKVKQSETCTAQSFSSVHTKKQAVTEEISSTVHNYLQQILGEEEEHLHVDEIGEVLSVADGIAYVSGLEHCINNELLFFTKTTYGIAMNLEAERVGVVLLGDTKGIRQGMYCKRTGKTISVPTGSALLGRVVDAMGFPLDGKGALENVSLRPIEFEAASVVDRQSVNQPLYTGITAIDAMTPIGKGQRELIIGDRQTGKTAIAVDAILNQKGKDVACIYVAIGQKMSTVAQVIRSLEKRGAMEYTTVVIASASESAALQYIAPYAGSAMAEQLMYEEKKDVLIVYDDLSKHAAAYRSLSLLLRRPPGREAFPGDVFYLHSRLLERALRLSEDLGGHSITALPIVETQAGDISAYVPTNVISITDGQIYLESELFFSGQRPAINVGLSVSRVGGAAQTKLMKSVAGSLRMNLAQFRELKAFSQFGSDLDASTQAILRKGSRIWEVLKQSQYYARSLSIHVILLFLATEGHLDTLELSEVRPFCQAFTEHLESLHQDFLQKVEASQHIKEVKDETLKFFESFLPEWQEERLNGTII